MEIPRNSYFMKEWRIFVGYSKYRVKILIILVIEIFMFIKSKIFIALLNIIKNNLFPPLNLVSSFDLK